MSADSRSRFSAAPLVGFAVALVLMVLAAGIPYLWQWNVHVFSWPPLHAEWDPRVGPGSIAAVILGVLAIRYAVQVTERMPWRLLVLASFVLSAAWLTALAAVDGLDGIGVILNAHYEYLNTARRVDDVSATLHEYVSRIPYSHPQNWPVHLAGHPPGALLFFVLLVRLGLDTGLEAGFAVLLVAATVPAALLLTLQRLGAEVVARRAAPFLVVGPAAIWMAVSGDAVFTAVAAWGICCLSVATTQNSQPRVAAWGALAGLLLGYCVMMSYGLPLLGVLAVAVLVAGRDLRPLPWAIGAAVIVVLAFASAGFAWWEAVPVLRERYWDGVASRRPPTYWLWGNLAALCFSAGPLVGASVAASIRGCARHRTLGHAERVAVLLTLAGAAMVVAADLSGMSRAEVERIWLPFVPWLVLGCALLSERWRRFGVAVQVIVALVIQHTLFTGW